MTEVEIRVWRAEDASSVDALLDESPDAYWLLQRRGVHGISPRADRYAITLVAEDASGVIGVATFYENRYHPGRYPATVEVRPDCRGRGVGRRLTQALLDRRPAPAPLEVKLRDANTAAMGFAQAVGMQRFQHCPVPTLNPADELITSWERGVPIPDGAEFLPIGESPAEATAAALVDQYEWVHERWSPMGDRKVIMELWLDYLAEADHQLSTIAVVDGRVAAVSLISLGSDTAEINVETTTRDEPNGTELVAACLARSIAQLDDAGVRSAELDGHDDDPHLRPVLDSMPSLTYDPVTLLELG